MKLYSVRDRLLDFHMNAFVGPGDKEVMSALADQINNEGNPNAIAKTPHHFELWQIAEIQDNQVVTPSQKLICDCAALVRQPSRSSDRPDRRNGTDSRTTEGSPQN